MEEIGTVTHNKFKHIILIWHNTSSHAEETWMGKGPSMTRRNKPQ